MDEIVFEGARSLFTNGVLGVVVAGLVYYLMIMRAEIREERKNHRIELAAKDALILDLQEKRLQGALAGAELARQFKDTFDAILHRRD